MSSKIIVPGKIITADQENRILVNHAVEISDGKIIRIFPFDKKKAPEGKLFIFDDLVMIPGFIQTHVHLCQTLFRGLADDLELLEWLQYRIFPYENAHNVNSLLASVKLGLYELIRSGTTTIMDMGTLRHQEIIFDELIRCGIRAFAGKCMMDRNDILPEFKSSVQEELEYTSGLAKEYHNKNSLIKYGFAPRFVLTSSEKLLKDTFELMQEFEGSIFHTHSSENKDECSRVRNLFGCDNIEYFNRIGVLGESTLLAHCVHVSDTEIGLLKGNNVKVAHCPSSNLKLGSGLAPVPEFIKNGITVSLGADGAPCSNTLNIFNEMRLASLIQKPLHGAAVMDARTVFRMATIEGAKALKISDKTGSIEEGKYADLVLLDLNNYSDPLLLKDNELYSAIVYSGNRENIKDVMINGEWIVSNGSVKGYDEKELVYNGKCELKKLIERV